MRNKIFADTSYFIALINEKDQYHQKAQDLAEVYIYHQLITTEAVLLEIGNSLFQITQTGDARNYQNSA